MPNPTINFRLSPYQLARGLWIIRKLEPEYAPSSVSQIVKLLYLDYLAKMSYGRSDIVPASLVTEVNQLISRSKTKTKNINLDDLILQTSKQEKQPIEEPVEEQSTESVIKSVTDFSPPKDWLTNIEENNND